MACTIQLAILASVRLLGVFDKDLRHLVSTEGIPRRQEDVIPYPNPRRAGFKFDRFN